MQVYIINFDHLHPVFSSAPFLELMAAPPGSIVPVQGIGLVKVLEAPVPETKAEQAARIFGRLIRELEEES